MVCGICPTYQAGMHHTGTYCPVLQAVKTVISLPLSLPAPVQTDMLTGHL